MKKFIAFSLLIILILAGCGNNSKIGETNTKKLNDVQVALMDKHPGFFGLDASGGLDVIVWEMAENSYHFGLLEHSEKEYDWLSDELNAFNAQDAGGVTADEMKEILATYNVESNDIYVVPWQNPISSYLSDFWHSEKVNGKDSEETKEKKQAYIDKISGLLGLK